MIIAIDPGASGGIATWHDGLVSAVKMPADITSHLRLLRSTEGAGVVYMEATGTYWKGESAVAACTFARHNGYLEGAVDALQLPRIMIQPKAWMTSVFGHSLSSDKKLRKNGIKDAMARKFPHIKVTLAVSDALALLCHAMKDRGLLSGLPINAGFDAFPDQIPPPEREP